MPFVEVFTREELCPRNSNSGERTTAVVLPTFTACPKSRNILCWLHVPGAVG
jgi:hypothetical protein